MFSRRCYVIFKLAEHWYHAPVPAGGSGSPGAVLAPQVVVRMHKVGALQPVPMLDVVVVVVVVLVVLGGVKTTLIL